MTIRSYKAGTSLKGNRFVTLSDDDTVKSLDSSIFATVGVVCNVGSDYAAGDTVDVVIDGITEVECAEVITRLSDISFDQNGKAITAGAGDKVVGKILETGAVGAFCKVLLK